MRMAGLFVSRSTCGGRFLRLIGRAAGGTTCGGRFLRLIGCAAGSTAGGWRFDWLIGSPAGSAAGSCRFVVSPSGEIGKCHCYPLLSEQFKRLFGPSVFLILPADRRWYKYALFCNYLAVLCMLPYNELGTCYIAVWEENVENKNGTAS